MDVITINIVVLNIVQLFVLMEYVKFVNHLMGMGT